MNYQQFPNIQLAPSDQLDARLGDADPMIQVFQQLYESIRQEKMSILHIELCEMKNIETDMAKMLMFLLKQNDEARLARPDIYAEVSKKLSELARHLSDKAINIGRLRDELSLQQDPAVQLANHSSN